MRRVALAALTLGLLAAAPAAAAPTLSTTSRLDDRRFVSTGTRAYELGTEAGRYPAMGFHTRGEMGGFWTPPLKLLDGVWFGIDGHWLAPARRFTSGYGHVTMDVPGPAGVRVRRVDFAPDGRRAVLAGLRLRAPTTRTVSVAVDAHSELMSAYPWGETTPSQLTFNLPDAAAFDGRRLVFTESGRPHPNAPFHSWSAVVGARERPDGGTTGAGFRGPQDPPVVCGPSGEGTPKPPPRCDDTAYGKGAGGQLRYRLRLRAGRTRTLWLAVAGSTAGRPTALREQAAALRDPEGALRRKVAARERLRRLTRLSLPGDRLLQQGIDWSKQNLADSVQEARGLLIRETNSGKQYPPPKGTLARIRFVGAGFPDYPWLFGTDGEYTAFASVAVGQFGPIEDHLRALRDVSRVVNGDSGKVVHEVVTDGSVYFGTNADPGNTDETAKFPSAVALVWRWTGDRRFRDEMYGFARRNMRYIVERLDADGDGWPEGLGNVERPGMGEEKLDNAVYTIRGLRDLADLARSKGDRATVRWAERRAARMEAAFDRDWWMPEIPQHADSLDDPGNHKVQQRHWIGVTPMEAELVRRGRPVLGLTTRARGNAALRLRETHCYGDAFGLYHTGAPGCDPAVSSVPPERQTFTLNTSIMAVAEGNYGRLGRGQQQRFTRANRRLQLPSPDEQPGAMPEIAPSPDYGRSIDKPFVERASVLQAWGNYGTIWPVVHQQLGVRPDMGRARLEVTPQLPRGQSRIAGRAIRLGRGSASVAASRRGRRYVTVVRPRVRLRRLTLGHTVATGARVRRVTLNGRRARYRLRRTHRGLEVLVRARTRGRQVLVVRLAG